MLPGFRFLFVAIVLSLSILVFGLGAAALLRAAHEEFASTPSWHQAPETIFAQHPEATRPVLAVLRVEPVAGEQKATDNTAAEPATNVAAPVEQVPSVAAPAAPERMATLEPEQGPTPETAKPEVAVSESPAPNEATPAAADAPVAADTASTAAPDAETKVASTEQVAPPANEAAAVESEPAASAQTGAPALPEATTASTKIATLGGPPVTIEAPNPAKASEKPDSGAVKKRQQARRAAHRRRMAARARQAQLTPLQPAADPFAQPTLAQPRVAARKH